MKLDRVTNTRRGVLWGLINRFIGMLIPFIIQAITIRHLGIEYVGIKGLFSSILTVFSLAELGFGSAIVYAMYKPIAEDDIDTICSLLNLYKKIYRIIGLIISILGIMLLPFLQFLIHGDYPEELNIQVVFLLYLLNTSLSYWLFAYKSALLTAYQRTDVTSNISTISQILLAIIQIIVLVLFRNFYLFLTCNVIATIINNIIISIVVDRMYPEIKCKGNVDESILKSTKKQVGGLLIAKICNTTRNSFDSIFISVFLGLTQTAIYANYFYVLAALSSIMIIILNSMSAGVGNSIVLNSKEKNYKDMMILNNIYLVVCGIMTSFMLCLYQPFMSLWAGEENLLPTYIMFLFPLYFYILKMGDIRSIYSDGAGLFWEDRWRNILETIANIILNYMLGKYWGVFGIVLATIITVLFVGFMGSTIITFKYYFGNGMKTFLKNQLILLICSTIICMSTYVVCEKIIFESMYMSIVFRIGICLTLAPFLYWLIFHKTHKYKDAIMFLKKAIKK